MSFFKGSVLEKITNIAVIVVAILFAVVFFQHEFRPHKTMSRAFDAQKLALTSITPTPAKLNVVLGISTECPFCEKNVGFYKKLSGLEKPGRMAFYTIFPQAKNEAESYLEKKGIHPTGVISSSLAKYQIKGTPTLVLVNDKGKVVHSWVGTLDSSKQAEVVRQIQEND